MKHQLVLIPTREALIPTCTEGGNYVEKLGDKNLGQTVSCSVF